MQDLINQLQQPIITYDDKGQMVTSAPTAIMLRAARELHKTITIMQMLERTNQQLAAYNNQLTEEYNRLQKELDDRRKAEQSAKSIPDDGGKVESVAHGQSTDSTGSDRNGEESSSS